MGKQNKRRLIGHLPLVFVATFLVVGAPLLLVFWLRTSGSVTSVWLGAVIGVAASFMASYAGAAFWKTRNTGSHDLLFSELMLWGWVQRWRSERRLSAAADLLGLTTGRPKAIPDGRLTVEEKAGLLTQFTTALEARDPYTHGHSRRVARHASNIAKRMGLSREVVARVRTAGAMHDVGKVETPNAVLHKQGKLTDEEFAIIKAHPEDGAVMVSTLGDADLTAMVRHHHERLDGTGYPHGLAGEAIPIGARILAVADTFDAITSTRPYRHAHAHKKALDILVSEAGTQLDPDAVRAFCSSYSGRRPLAYWAVLINARPRLAPLLGSGLSTAKAATANVMAAAAAATVAGAGGLVLEPLAEPPAESRNALAADGSTSARSTAARGASVPAPRPAKRQAVGNRGGSPKSKPRVATVPLARPTDRRPRPGPSSAVTPPSVPVPPPPVPVAPPSVPVTPPGAGAPSGPGNARGGQTPGRGRGNGEGPDTGRPGGSFGGGGLLEGQENPGRGGLRGRGNRNEFLPDTGQPPVRGRKPEKEKEKEKREKKEKEKEKEKGNGPDPDTPPQSRRPEQGQGMARGGPWASSWWALGPRP